MGSETSLQVSPIPGAVLFVAGTKDYLTEAETRVGDQEEIDQVAISGGAALVDQLGGLGLVQVELDDGADDIPRGILAADQVVRLVVVERVRLQEAPVGKPEPLVAIQAVVRSNAPGSGRRRRRHSRGHVGSERQGDVASCHLREFVDGRAVRVVCWKQARAGRDIMSDLGDWPIRRSQRTLCAVPAFRQEAMEQAGWLGTETGRVERLRHFKLPFAQRAQTCELQQEPVLAFACQELELFAAVKPLELAEPRDEPVRIELCGNPLRTLPAPAIFLA